MKIREEHGRLIREERRIIYGDLDEDDIDTVNVESFNVILRERVGRLVRKTKCFSKKRQRLYYDATLFQFYWNFMMNSGEADLLQCLRILQNTCGPGPIFFMLNQDT